MNDNFIFIGKKNILHTTDHCLQASMETTVVPAGASASAAGGVELDFLEGLALVAAAFFAFDLVAVVFAMVTWLFVVPLWKKFYLRN